MGHSTVSRSAASEGDGAPLQVSNGRRWGLVALLFVSSFINYLDRATISVALPFISLDLNLRPQTKGVLLSCFFWSYALMQIPVGMWVDRKNLRWLYAVFFAIWSLACGFTGFAGSLAILILARMLLGVGESIYLPGGTKVVSMVFAPHERAFPSGLFDSGTRAGLAVGAPVIAALVLKFGWRKMFMMVGFTALLWIVPWIFTAPKNFRTLSTPALPTREKRFPRIRISRNLVGICLGFFCFDYYWYMFLTWLPDYLMTVRHLPLVRAGFYAALPYLVFGVAEPLGGWLTDYLILRGYDATRTRKTILTVAFLTGILIIPAARAHTAHGALAYLCGGSIVGLAAGNLFAIIQACAPPEELGTWTGIENFVGNIGGILGPLVMGFLIARTGTYLPGFALASGVLAAGILAYWFVVGELKPDC